MTAQPALSIRNAADILGISNRASMNEIRSRYHMLVKEYHPDISPGDPANTHDTMVRINAAYEILIGYCMNYEISFCPEDLKGQPTDPSIDLWMERYGDDPIWGTGRSPPR